MLPSIVIMASLSWVGIPTAEELAAASSWDEFSCWDDVPDAEFSCWDDVPIAPDVVPYVQKQAGPRKTSSNKRARRFGLMDAEAQALSRMQIARTSQIPCSKTCLHKTCMQRVAKEASVDDVVKKLTWRHCSMISERRVASAMISELREGYRENRREGYHFSLQVGCVQNVCENAHAFFNGMWDDNEHRPNRTFRRYLAEVRDGYVPQHADVL